MQFVLFYLALLCVFWESEISLIYIEVASQRHWQVKYKDSVGTKTYIYINKYINIYTYTHTQ